ncbi:MAG: MraY family glycosyltransferase [Planctomycetota bacterium]
MSDAFHAPAFMLAAAATVSATAFTGLAVRLASKWGCLDRPDGGRKDHQEAVPVLGGVAIFVALLVATAFAAGVPAISELFRGTRLLTATTLIVSAGGFCLLGFLDDVRPLSPTRKLVGQVVAALPFALWGQPVETVAFLGWDVFLGGGGIVFTVVWLVATANVFNLIDGLDGLAGTVGLIACAAIGVVAESRGFPDVACVALALGGGLLGFLSHNLPPARIFLGDSGSMLVGFLIGALSILSSLKTATGFAMAVPLILISLPAFDTLMAIVRRRLSGVGIGTGDRLHIHHRLRERGLTPGQTLAAIALLSLTMAVLCVVAAVYHNDRLGVLLCGGLLASLVVGRIFGHHEAMLTFRKLKTLATVIGETAGLGRRTSGPPRVKSWDEASAMLEQLGVVSARVVIDGKSVRLIGGESGGEKSVTVSVGRRTQKSAIELVCVGHAGLAGPKAAAAFAAVAASALRELDAEELFEGDNAVTLAFPPLERDAA